MIYSWGPNGFGLGWAGLGIGYYDDKGDNIKMIRYIFFK